MSFKNSRNERQIESKQEVKNVEKTALIARIYFAPTKALGMRDGSRAAQESALRKDLAHEKYVNNYLVLKKLFALRKIRWLHFKFFTEGYHSVLKKFLYGITPNRYESAPNLYATTPTTDLLYTRTPMI